MKSVGLLVIALLLLVCATAHAIEATKPETIPTTTWSRAGEFLIDTNVVNLNSQCNPVAAFDGKNYLVVWEDDRNGNWDIYGARVSQTGSVIDPIAIPISIARNDQRNPAICFCGADYLVVWDDTRNDSFGDIYGARINQIGGVVDSLGIAISTATYGQLYPHIAFDGTNYLVVWEDTRNDTFYQFVPDIYGARVNQSGVVLDSLGIGIKVDSINPYWQPFDFQPSLAFGGSQYLVVWTFAGGPWPDHTEIWGLRVDISGAVIDTTAILLSFPMLSPSPCLPVVAFDGMNYLTAWWAYFEESTSIECIRVDQDGKVLDTAVITINTTGTSFFPPYPSVSVAFDGIYYVIAWHDSSNVDFDIYGVKIDINGIVIDSFLSSAPGSQITPTLAHGTGDQVFITYSGWTDSINGQPVNTMRIWGKFYPFVGVEEGETNIVKQYGLDATIFRGPLRLPEGKQCRVFDITGRVVEPTSIVRGIYFIEVDGVVTQKVVKVR